MEKITGNEPAMPCKIDDYDRHIGNITRNVGGLTIRQHFAAMAMQGLCNKPIFTGTTPENLAKEAVQYADALITELNKEKP